MNRAPETADSVLRHYLAGLVFRFRHATEGTSEEFADFSAGEGVRTPREIVRHMTGLVLFAHDQFEELAAERPERLTWSQERARLVESVWQLHLMTEGAGGLRPGRRIDTLAQVWHGPLSDLMTHVGQLATLRRLFGDPVGRVRYWQVECPGPGEDSPPAVDE